MQPKYKKSLGQNFLVDKNVQNKIIEYCNFDRNDIVLEIGPGRGEITQLLLDKVKEVKAIEIDSQLCKVLRNKFGSYQNFKLENQDILKVDLASLLKSRNISLEKLKVIGNLPYYISTPIITKLIEHRKYIDAIFLTLQKELGMRLAAKPHSKDYGSFSCYLQFYTEPEILFFIKNSSFWPKPKVDSCFLRIKILPKPKIKVKNEKLFFKVIRTSFGMRRKLLRNNLTTICSQEKVDEVFKKFKIAPNSRAEDLSLKDFARLSNYLDII